MKEFKCQCGETNPDNFPSNGHKDSLGISYQRKNICKKCYGQYARGMKPYCNICGKKNRYKLVVLLRQKSIYICKDCVAMQFKDYPQEWLK